MRASLRRAAEFSVLAVLAGLLSSAPVSAQQRPQPNLNPEDQLAPSQIQQPMPAPVAEPGGSSAGGGEKAPKGAAPARPTGAQPPPRGAAPKPADAGAGRHALRRRR